MNPANIIVKNFINKEENLILEKQKLVIFVLQ